MSSTSQTDSVAPATKSSGEALSPLTIPQEIAEFTLSLCHPRDVIAFSMACRLAYSLVHDTTDQFIWRHIFLSLFDDPHLALKAPRGGQGRMLDSPTTGKGWKAEIARRFMAEHACKKHAADEAVYELLLTMIQDATPANENSKFPNSIPSRNLLWLARVLRESRVLSDESKCLDDQSTACRRLRSYVALSFEFDSVDDSINAENPMTSALRTLRSHSRRYVYDLRNYAAETHWGPFHWSRKVNWEHVEALVNVVMLNLREMRYTWPWARETIPPAGPEFTRAYSAPGGHSSTDWAGVEGTWARYVCFMDYRDLFAFNFTSIAGGPRNPAYFHDPSFREATRLIELTLHLTSPESLRFRGETDTDTLGCIMDDPQYPPLYFCGKSRGANGNEATVEGNVRMSAEGVVLWRFVSVYDGHTQWSSEGVQLGNVASAMGVIGVWTSDIHEDGDPAGKFFLKRLYGMVATDA
ncbi:hypothetical protein HGRIS_007497 [Hohenbuehelia grisea]|uniref:F-box domain-containing protein n=1 Tax=Hohenbuehelia grisea TaxID=104357 RepID=A0ABR3J5D9_9AGAR